MARRRKAEALSELAPREAIWRAPLDRHLIWTGAAALSQPGSLRSRALGLVTVAW